MELRAWCRSGIGEKTELGFAFEFGRLATSSERPYSSTLQCMQRSGSKGVASVGNFRRYR